MILMTDRVCQSCWAKSATIGATSSLVFVPMITWWYLIHVFIKQSKHVHPHYVDQWLKQLCEICLILRCVRVVITAKIWVQLSVKLNYMRWTLVKNICILRPNFHELLCWEHHFHTEKHQKLSCKLTVSDKRWFRLEKKWLAVKSISFWFVNYSFKFLDSFTNWDT